MTIEARTAVANYLLKLDGTWDWVGSTYTCNPPPRPPFTDIDWVVYVPSSRHHKFEAFIIKYGFMKDGSHRYATSRPGVSFNSWRYGDTNLIVTNSIKFRDKFVLAAKVCKHMNLLQKPDRILIHKAIMEGKFLYDE